MKKLVRTNRQQIDFATVDHITGFLFRIAQFLSLSRDQLERTEAKLARRSKINAKTKHCYNLIKKCCSCPPYNNERFNHKRSV